MNSMFWYNNHFNQDISHWDVSNVEYNYGMFMGASSFNKPLPNFKVLSSLYMVQNANSFNQSLSHLTYYECGGSFSDENELFNHVFNGTSVTNIDYLPKIVFGDCDN